MTDATIQVLLIVTHESQPVAESVEHAQAIGTVVLVDLTDSKQVEEYADRAGITLLRSAFTSLQDVASDVLSQLPETTAWVFIQTASEWATPTLIKQVKKAAATNSSSSVAMTVCRVDIFAGKKIRHGGFAPAWEARLINHTRFREHLLSQGTPSFFPLQDTTRLDGQLLNDWGDPVSRFIHQLINEANTEARSRLWEQSRDRSQLTVPIFRPKFSRQSHWAYRAVWPMLLGRPFLRFVYSFVVRLGFLDGRAGWHIALLAASFEQMTGLLYRELAKSGGYEGTKESTDMEAAKDISAPTKISVLILTLNEEENLPGCLNTVQWSDDIVVLDSFSSDQSPQIAEAAGARIIQRPFDNWSSHQNWAMSNIDFKHKWVLYLDADERVVPEFRDEITQLVRNEHDTNVAYYCGRRNFFLGKWIRHAMPPSPVMRFFQPSKISFERLVNPTPVISGPHGYLRTYFDHYTFSKGLTEWIDKHNKYSQFEAVEGIKQINSQRAPFKALFIGDRASRRKALKNLSFRLPLRPILKFGYMYVLKGGCLDGRAGLTYCCLQAIYEYMIGIKMKELSRKERGLPV